MYVRFFLNKLTENHNKCCDYIIKILTIHYFAVTAKKKKKWRVLIVVLKHSYDKDPVLSDNHCNETMLI